MSCVTHSTSIICQPCAADVTGANPTASARLAHCTISVPFTSSHVKKRSSSRLLPVDTVAAPRPRRNMKMATEVLTQLRVLQPGQRAEGRERNAATYNKNDTKRPAGRIMKHRPALQRQGSGILPQHRTQRAAGHPSPSTVNPQNLAIR